jgi:hypothetical protein
MNVSLKRKRDKKQQKTSIELIWATVKDFIAARNVSFEDNDVMKIAEKIQHCKQRGTGSPMHAGEEN